MAKDIRMNIELTGSDKAIKSMKDLKTFISDSKKELENLEIGSEAFNTLAENIATAEVEAQKLNKKLKDLAPMSTGKAFATMGKMVAGSFATATGALALFGGESEKMGRMMKQVQGSIALVLGIRELAEYRVQAAQLSRTLSEKAALVVTKASAVANGITTATLGVMGIAANTTSTGFKLLKIAIASTGIGLILIALGAVAAYWDDIKGAVSGVSSEMQGQLTLATKNKEAALAQMQTTSDTENILKLQGKSQREILLIKMKDIDAAIMASEIEITRQKSMKDSQVAAAERNQRILAGMLKFLTAPIDALIYAYNLIPGLSDIEYASDSIATFFFDASEVGAEGDALIAESESALLKLQNQRAGFQLNINSIDEKAADKRAATKQKIDDDAMAWGQNQAKMMEDIANDMYGEIEDIERDALLASLERDAVEGESAMEKLLREQEDMRAIEEMKLQFWLADQERRAYEIEDTEMQKQALYAIEEAFEIKKAKLQGKLKKTEDKGKKKQAKNDKIAREDTKRATLGLYGDLAGAMGGLFGEAKEFAIAEALINTYLGVSAGIKKGAPHGYIEAGISLISGLAAVKSITSTDKGSSDSGGSDMAPKEEATPMVSGLDTLDFSGSIKEDEDEPVRAYVITDDMTDSQKQMGDIRDRATM